MADMALATFTLFSTLPPEVRHMIWNEALLSQRHVKVTAGYIKQIQNPGVLLIGRARGPQEVLFNFNTSLLLACQESRELALKHSLEHYTPQLALHRNGRPLLLNFQADCFVIEDRRALMTFIATHAGPVHEPLVKQEIERFLDEIRHLVLGGEMNSIALGFTSSLKSLETVTFQKARRHRGRAQVEFQSGIVNTLLEKWTAKWEGRQMPTVIFKTNVEIDSLA